VPSASTRRAGLQRSSDCLTRVVFWAGCCWVLEALVAATAVASPSDQITLQFSAPQGCPQGPDVLRAVDLDLGADFVTDTRLRVEAEVVRLDTSDYELVIHYATTRSGASDQRRIHGESCAVLRDASALFLALALNPLGTHRETPDPPLPAVDTPTARPTLVSGPSFAALVDVNTAVLPAVAWAGRLRAGWHSGGLHISASLLIALPQDTTSGDVTTRLNVWSVDVGACYLVGTKSLLLGPCAHLEVGRLSGKSRGPLDAALAGSARWQAATLAAEARLRIVSPLWLSFGAGLEWIERRPQFVVRGLGTVASPAPFGARIAVGPMLLW
jgi:hypothetical protein